MKKTNLYPPDIKPIRKGLYQVKVDVSEYKYSWFDGKNWSYVRESKKDAYECRMYMSWSQNKQWRGLARNPE